MKKITILSLHLNVGGIENCVSSLANLLCDAYDVEIVSTYKFKNSPFYYINDKVKIKYLIDNTPNKKEFKKALKSFQIANTFKEGFKSLKILYLKYKLNKNYIKKCDSDIIISTRDYFNKLIGKYANCKQKIAWEHNYPKDKKYYKKVVKSCKDIDYLVNVTEDINDIYKKDLKEKCICINNFVDELPTITSNLNNKNLISVGRLSKEKGFVDLIKVFNQVYKKNNKVHLDIIGDGEEYNNIYQEIQKHNLNHAVTMHGYKDKKFINMLYQNSCIYVMTSLTESFGLVLVEAMSYGLPCIAFDSAEGAKTIINNNGYLIKDRDINQMAITILKLLDDKEKLKELSNNALETSKKYDKKIIKKHWLKLLERS